MPVKSYTQYSIHKKCGAQYAYRYVERLPTPQKSAAAARGTSIHDGIEHYFQGEADAPPDEVDFYHEWMAEIKGKQPIPELHFTLTYGWEHAEYPDCDMQGYVDLVVPGEELVAYEWKSGQRYEDHPDQRQFYATSLLSVFPESKSAKVHGVYLDKGDVQPTDVTSLDRAMLPHFQDEWGKKMKVIDNELTHVPSPGPWCKWCPFNKESGGPCKFG